MWPAWLQLLIENVRKLKGPVEGDIMAKGYWIVFYQSCFKSRGTAVKVFEAGIKKPV